MARLCGIVVAIGLAAWAPASAQQVQIVEPNPFLAGQPVSAGITLTLPMQITAVRLNGVAVAFQQISGRTALFQAPAPVGTVSGLEVDLANGTTIDHEVPVVTQPVPLDVMLNRKADFVQANTSPPGPPQEGLLAHGIGASVEGGLRQAAGAFASQDVLVGINRLNAVQDEIAALSGTQILAPLAQFLLEQLQEADPCSSVVKGSTFLALRPAARTMRRAPTGSAPGSLTPKGMRSHIRAGPARLCATVRGSCTIWPGPPGGVRFPASSRRLLCARARSRSHRSRIGHEPPSSQNRIAVGGTNPRPGFRACSLVAHVQGRCAAFRGGAGCGCLADGTASP